MNELLNKYNDYMRLENCHAEYELIDGTKISVSYRKENFAHLIGLHKLKDIQVIQFWLDKNNKTVKLDTLLKKIKKETFTDKMVKSSVFYPKIKERYEKFTYDNLTTLNYTDVIVDFKPEIINSKIKSDYLLFEKKADNTYNHMGIALDNSIGYRYIETFFNESTGMYMKGQNIVKIKSFTLYDRNNEIIVADSFFK
jgi:hypothetical protein